MAQILDITQAKTTAAVSDFSAPSSLEWAEAMQATSGIGTAAAQDSEHLDLAAQAQGLEREISRIMNEYRALSHTAGAAESHQQNQINMLMTMIASLGRKIDASQMGEARDVQQAYGQIGALRTQLSARRFEGESDRMTASITLGQMQVMQGNIQAALAQILQQLSALHMRMGSLV